MKKGMNHACTPTHTNMKEEGGRNPTKKKTGAPEYFNHTANKRRGREHNNPNGKGEEKEEKEENLTMLRRRRHTNARGGYTPLLSGSPLLPFLLLCCCTTSRKGEQSGRGAEEALSPLPHRGKNQQYNLYDACLWRVGALSFVFPPFLDPPAPQPRASFTPPGYVREMRKRDWG